MEIKNRKDPTADFYNFEIYPLKTSNGWIEQLKDKRSIVVVLNRIIEEDLVLLAKIFQAIGKKMEEEVCLIDGSDGLNYKDLRAVLDLEELLVFGMTPNEMGLHLSISAYQIVEFQNARLLFSHDLNTIANDLSKKKQLWQQLQLLF
ncbi:hypothetical protein [Aureispira anguillae]|uniref:Uncharacterized protein n=1 Tax=Aureispira anguillae TaxID=2864201 RepID=A0A915YCP8_9BACT|nr:hypothetical protein [Aureispira anguillae]BDS10633.1 hypothetical protein AsAng_0013420 [Aureispira anguillae]